MSYFKIVYKTVLMFSFVCKLHTHKKKITACNDCSESEISPILLCACTHTDTHRHKDTHTHTHTHTHTTLYVEHNMVSERLIVCLMECMNLILLKGVLITKELDCRGQTHTNKTHTGW